MPEEAPRKRTRRSNREGTSWQEGSRYRWRLRLTVNGQKIQYDVSEDSAEARRKEVMRVQREIEQLGVKKPTKELTVANALRQWHRVAVVPRLAAKTAETYLYHVNAHIIPRIGNVRLSKLTKHDVQNRLIQPMVEEFAAAGTGGERTIQMTRDILRNALEWAIEQSLITANPAKGTWTPSPPERQMRVMSEDEIPLLLDAAYTRGKFCLKDAEWRTRYAPLFELILNTGCRISEALALQVIDVDIRREQLHIKKQLEFIREKDADGKFKKGKDGLLPWRFEKTKNKKSRTIELNADAVAAVKRMLATLKEERAAAASAYQDNGLLFPSESGRPPHPRSVQRALDGALDAAELPHYGLHDLRRTFGTSLADAGVPPHVLMVLMGHEKVETTMTYYIKARETARRSAVATLSFRTEPAGKVRQRS